MILFLRYYQFISSILGLRHFYLDLHSFCNRFDSTSSSADGEIILKLIKRTKLFVYFSLVNFYFLGPTCVIALAISSWPYLTRKFAYFHMLYCSLGMGLVGSYNLIFAPKKLFPSVYLYNLFLKFLGLCHPHSARVQVDGNNDLGIRHNLASVVPV